jgi:hypothetical protein
LRRSLDFAHALKLRDPNPSEEMAVIAHQAVIERLIPFKTEGGR